MSTALSSVLVAFFAGIFANLLRRINRKASDHFPICGRSDVWWSVLSRDSTMMRDLPITASLFVYKTTQFVSFIVRAGERCYDYSSSSLAAEAAALPHEPPTPGDACRVQQHPLSTPTAIGRPCISRQRSQTILKCLALFLASSEAACDKIISFLARRVSACIRCEPIRARLSQH